MRHAIHRAQRDCMGCRAPARPRDPRAHLRQRLCVSRRVGGWGRACVGASLLSPLVPLPASQETGVFAWAFGMAPWHGPPGPDPPPLVPNRPSSDTDLSDTGSHVTCHALQLREWGDRRPAVPQPLGGRLPAGDVGQHTGRPQEAGADRGGCCSLLSQILEMVPGASAWSACSLQPGTTPNTLTLAHTSTRRCPPASSPLACPWAPSAWAAAVSTLSSLCLGWAPTSPCWAT